MEKKVWYFTFLADDPVYGGYCQPIRARSWGEAREKMFELHGDKWCSQYSEGEWETVKRRQCWYPLEKELDVIEVLDGYF